MRFPLFILVAGTFLNSILGCESRTSQAYSPHPAGNEKFFPKVLVVPLPRANEYRIDVAWSAFDLPHRCVVDRMIRETEKSWRTENIKPLSDFSRIQELKSNTYAFSDLSAGPDKIHRYRIICSRLFDQMITQTEVEGQTPEDLEVNETFTVAPLSKGYGRIFIGPKGRLVANVSYAKLFSSYQIVAEPGAVLDIRTANFPLEPLIEVNGDSHTQLKEHPHKLDWLSQGTHDMTFTDTVGSASPPDFEKTLPVIPEHPIPRKREDLTEEIFRGYTNEPAYDLFFVPHSSPWYQSPKFSEIITWTLHATSLKGSLSILNRRLCYQPSENLPPNWEAELTKKIAGACGEGKHPLYPVVQLEIGESPEGSFSVKSIPDIKGNMPPPVCIRSSSVKSEFWTPLCDNAVLKP